MPETEKPIRDGYSIRASESFHAPMKTLFAYAAECLAESDPQEKILKTRRVAESWADGALRWESNGPIRPITEPGRPDRPHLVSPAQVPWRGVADRAERAALIHALAHIEFNAVNLAWDAVYRFRGLPKAFYDDWIQVAVDEARHFQLLRERLRAHEADYGDFDAHNGLWEMAVKTADDLVARMALVPRVLEARSLDVTPTIIQRLRSVGDSETADVIAVIERDEQAHVTAGSRWFRYACEARGLDPEPTFRQLVRRYMKGRLKKPFNARARRDSGFSEVEVEDLMEMLG